MYVICIPYGPWALNGRPWALMGWALMGFPGPLWASLGPYGPGPYEPSLALMGRALNGPPWTLMGWALMGPPTPPLPGHLLSGFLICVCDFVSMLLFWYFLLFAYSLLYPNGRSQMYTGLSSTRL